MSFPTSHGVYNIKIFTRTYSICVFINKTTDPHVIFFWLFVHLLRQSNLKKLWVETFNFFWSRPVIYIFKNLKHSWHAAMKMKLDHWFHSKWVIVKEWRNNIYNNNNKDFKRTRWEQLLNNKKKTWILIERDEEFLSYQILFSFSFYFFFWQSNITKVILEHWINS